MMKVFDCIEVVIDRECIRAAVPGNLDNLTQVQAVWHADHPVRHGAKPDQS